MRTYKEIEKFAEWSEEDKDQFAVNVIKGLVMDGVRNANSGHTGGAMSSADFVYVLFADFLNFDPTNSTWFNRDRFVLSAGHESMLLYSILYLIGWFKKKDLKQFRQLDSDTPGHPEVRIPGVEATTGPLGQGVGVAVGMTLAEAFLNETIGDLSKNSKNIISHYTYVLVGDGDLQEPVSLGAAALAGHWNLHKLIMFYDSNSAQISGNTTRADSTDVISLFEGLGWHIQKIDGHDHDAIRDAIQTSQVIERPALIIGETNIGNGCANMEGDHNTHGVPLPQKEIEQTKEKFGLPNKQFYVPKCVINHFQKRFGDLSNTSANWNSQLRKLRKGKVFNKQWSQIVENKILNLELPEFNKGEFLATRKAFGITLEKFAEQIPHLVGGSADLEPSNYTGGFAKAYGDFQKGNRKKRNLAFGVREFPMASILNGMALHGGMIPFGGTFLVFSDYARPALRSAAMQEIRVIHEFSHDSFYVGEDGPTHQPVEHIMALRTIPNYTVFRPADPKETAVCFKIAIESNNSPSALLLTRQSVPILFLSYNRIEAGVKKGAYIISDCEGAPEIVLIATGSEVSLAMDVANSLKGKRIRVVSMPSWELFEKQSKTYKENLIPPRGCLKVSLEAGITLGWERYVGPSGLMIGLETYGLSAPYKELADRFGFTPQKVISKINKHLKKLL
ncbi:MAG: transketolase [Candidatus Neomarinimicrobiota bacterium]